MIKLALWYLKKRKVSVILNFWISEQATEPKSKNVAIIDTTIVGLDTAVFVDESESRFKRRDHQKNEYLNGKREALNRLSKIEDLCEDVLRGEDFDKSTFKKIIEMAEGEVE